MYPVGPIIAQYPVIIVPRLLGTVYYLWAWGLEILRGATYMGRTLFSSTQHFLKPVKPTYPRVLGKKNEFFPRGALFWQAQKEKSPSPCPYIMNSPLFKFDIL